MNECINETMNIALDNYKNSKYYTSKQKRIDFLPHNSLIIEAIWEVILPLQSYTSIQNIGTKLGFALGFTNQLDAIKTGAEILSLTHGNLFDLELTDTGINIIPKITNPDKTENPSPEFQCPAKWKNNRNKYGSVIMGYQNHHDDKQGLDALNLLQQVQWEIDPVVLTTECPPIVQTEHDFLPTYVKFIGKPFHFIWKFDKRGRSYSHSWQLNIQSQEYDKAILSFANQRVTKHLDNLKIAIANHAGLDKLTWDARLTWFNHQTSFSTENFAEPILGRKAIRAYERAIQNKPSGYLMGVDATASGLQIMAALSGCKQTAKNCNLVNNTQRVDIYSEVADQMNNLLSSDEKVTRTLVKKPVMTHYYNSIDIPETAFSPTQLNVFYSVLNNLCPGAESVMETINHYWDSSTTCHSWVLPDGHVVKVPVSEMIDCRIEIDELEHRRFTYRYNKIQPSKNFRSLAPNIIHSIDGYIAREMVRRANKLGFELVHIHDNFLFLPDYLQIVCRLYREIMSEITNSNLLATILSTITGQPIVINKLSDDLHLDILTSNYMLS